MTKLPPAIALALAIASAPAAAAPHTNDAADVLAAVQAFILADTARDEQAMRKLAYPKAMTMAAICGPDNYLQEPLESYIKKADKSPAARSEKLIHPEVRVDTHLATVWARYEYRYDSEQDPTEGYSSFQLIRTKGGWKILNYSWSTWTEGCDQREDEPKD